MVRFFPAGGRRNFENGCLPMNRGDEGRYLASSVYTATAVWYMQLQSWQIGLAATARSGGLSVRCVACEFRNYGGF